MLLTQDVAARTDLSAFSSVISSVSTTSRPLPHSAVIGHEGTTAALEYTAIELQAETEDETERTSVRNAVNNGQPWEQELLEAIAATDRSTAVKKFQSRHGHEGFAVIVKLHSDLKNDSDRCVVFYSVFVTKLLLRLRVNRIFTKLWFPLDTYSPSCGCAFIILSQFELCFAQNITLLLCFHHILLACVHVLIVNISQTGCVSSAA